MGIDDDLEEDVLNAMVEMEEEDIEQEAEGPVAVTDNRQHTFKEDQEYSARDDAGSRSTVAAMFIGADKSEPDVRAETVGAISELSKR